MSYLEHARMPGQGNWIYGPSAESHTLSISPPDHWQHV